MNNADETENTSRDREAAHAAAMRELEIHEHDAVAGGKLNPVRIPSDLLLYLHLKYGAGRWGTSC